MGDMYSGIDTCPKCVKEEEDKARAEHFAKLDAMTLEERVRRLEELQYDHSKVRHGYIPPPKF